MKSRSSMLSRFIYKKYTLYKVGISVFLGLMGVLCSFFPLRFEFPGNTVTVVWFYFFPLLAALAYGPRYGFLAGLIGAVVSLPPFIGPANCWTNGISVILFLIFYIWHGYCAMARRNASAFWNHPLAVQIPFAFLHGILTYSLFPVFYGGLLTFSSTNMEFVLSFRVLLDHVLGNTISMYGCVLLATFILMTTEAGRVLRLPRSKSARSNGIIFIASIAVIGGMWFVWQTLNTLYVRTDFPKGLIHLSTSYEVITLFVIVALGLVIGYVVALLLERRYAFEESLSHGQEQLQILMGASPISISWADRQGKILYLNKRFRELFGYDLDDIPTLEHWYQCAYPDPIYRTSHVAAWQAGLEKARDTGVPADPIETSIVCKDGSIREVLIAGAIAPDRILAMFNDITERKRTEKALQHAEEFTRALLENVLDGIAACDANGKLILINRTAREWHGVEPQTMPPEEWASHFDLYKPDGVTLLKVDEVPLVRALHGETVRNEEMTILAKGQSPRYILGNSSPLFDADHHILGAIASMRDITVRRRSEEALQREQEFSKALLDSLPGIFYLYTYPELRLVRWNKNHETHLGFGPGEINDRFILEWHPPAVRDAVRKVIDQVMEKGMDVIESSLLAKDGHLIPFLMTGIRFEADGQLYLMGVGIDITERVHAEEEREKLEIQLRQAQKMEAVGQLAGGIAHDFNNLLQVILGRLDLIQDDLPQDMSNTQEIDEVRKAAERAADLTRQLLAFSRRQIIQPINLDLNDLIEGLLKMIRRFIGEHIELRFIPGARLGTIHADKGQVEQVLMNLCVNARDAMSGGGVLTIETENVLISDDYCSEHPWAMEGRYVLLSVMDTGHGMDETTCSQVFEPFFTTKEVGHGTGLGLATVYGIVKQHNGMIQVYSELEKGTVFKVYFPIVERPAEEVGSKIESPVVGGSETILVAEDEEGVRSLVSRMLQSAGYTVLMACDGEDALRVFEEHADSIDMALLDVMMPKLGGREVMDYIHMKCPSIRFLFSSGYSENAIHTNFVIKKGIHLISKPYRKPDLLRAVRATLDA